MELLVMAYTLKTSSAQNIIGVIPYFPYSKQCKMRKRGSIVCKLLASMLAEAGMSLFFFYSLLFRFHKTEVKVTVIQWRHGEMFMSLLFSVHD